MENHGERLAADRLWQAAMSKTACKPVRDLIGDTDQKAAYRVQTINTNRRTSKGETVVGYKIGLTSEAVQKQLGVNQPDFGVLTDAMMLEADRTNDYSLLMQPKAEAEIAFVAGADMNNTVATTSELVNYIDCAIASIEVVGSRIANWDIRITDTIADNASASHFVLGAEKVSLRNLDLINCKMTLTQNNKTVSEGTGHACMGNPLNAALWLVNKMIEMNTPIKAGHVILAGALGPMVNVHKGDRFEAIITGVGRASVYFS
ncbi:MAG: 2-keto-4-pentenoate hydratase [Salibacteraceae bacterium]